MNKILKLFFRKDERIKWTPELLLEKDIKWTPELLLEKYPGCDYNDSKCGAFLHYKWLTNEENIRNANEYCSKNCMLPWTPEIKEMQGIHYITNPSDSYLAGRCDMQFFEIKKEVKQKCEKAVRKYTQEQAFILLKKFCDFVVCADLLNGILIADELQPFHMSKDDHYFYLPISLYSSKTGSFSVIFPMQIAIENIAKNYNIEMLNHGTGIKHKIYGTYKGKIPMRKRDC